MNINRRQYLVGSLSAGVLATLPWQVSAQSRSETIRHLIASTINTLDPTVPGVTREVYGLSVCVYDRLINFGKTMINGNPVFDQSVILPGLAERIETSPDGLKITFHIRKNAKWHDGTPVTAEDIKWSLDRAVSAKSLAPAQLSSGDLTRTDQFRIAGPNVVEVLLDKPNRLALANLGVPYAIMVNSKLAKKHATDDDPWALKFTQNNDAGSGAYKVKSFRPGEQVVLDRNEDWVSNPDGKLAHFKRAIIQTVAEPATRANLIEKGDADIVLDLQASDIQSLKDRGKVKIVSNALQNGFQFIAMNTQEAPFDNVKVRKAIAAALPYEDMFKAALFERGKPLFNGDWTGTPPTADFPNTMPNKTDLKRAKELLAEAGYKDGFETTFSFPLGNAAVSEPVAALLQESLAKIGIRVKIQKLPNAQFGTLHAEKKLPFFIYEGSAWLPKTFYFFWVYFTRNQRWNHASWKNARIEELVDKARYETDQGAYDAECKEMVSILAEEVPMILLWQQNQDAVMSKDIEGYAYHYHRQVDFRDLSRV